MKIFIFNIFLILSFIKFNLVNKKCNRKLLNSYGLRGYYKFSYKINYMCPNIKHNCCTYSDQKKIYMKYILKGEMKNINNFYNNYYNIYKKIFKSFDLLSFYIYYKLNMVRLANSSINCRLMARKIEELDWKYIKTIILNNLKITTDFFKKIKFGFYCFICDYDSHKYIFLEKKIIKLNKKFCSHILKNSMNYLEFKYTMFPKITYLISTFLVKCTSGFIYKKNKFLKKRIWFKESNILKKYIKFCIDNKTQKDWFNYCKIICSYFSWDKFSKFFFGEISKLLYYSKYIDKKVKFLVDPILLNKDIWYNIPYFQDIYKNQKYIINNQKFKNIRFLENKIKINEENKKNEKNKKKITNQDIKEFNSKFRISLIMPITYSYKKDFNNKYNFSYSRDIFLSDYLHETTEFDYQFGWEGIDLYKYYNSEIINENTVKKANIMKLKYEKNRYRKTNFIHKYYNIFFKKKFQNLIFINMVYLLFYFN